LCYTKMCSFKSDVLLNRCPHSQIMAKSASPILCSLLSWLLYLFSASPSKSKISLSSWNSDWRNQRQYFINSDRKFIKIISTKNFIRRGECRLCEFYLSDVSSFCGHSLYLIKMISLSIQGHWILVLLFW